MAGSGSKRDCNISGLETLDKSGVWWQGAEERGGGPEAEDLPPGHPGARDDEDSRGLLCAQETLPNSSLFYL